MIRAPPGFDPLPQLLDERCPAGHRQEHQQEEADAEVEGLEVECHGIGLDDLTGAVVSDDHFRSRLDGDQPGSAILQRFRKRPSDVSGAGPDVVDQPAGRDVVTGDVRDRPRGEIIPGKLLPDMAVKGSGNLRLLEGPVPGNGDLVLAHCTIRFP